MNVSPYRHYMIALLAIIYASNNVDRLALGIVLPDIKAELHMSDTQLGFLTGIAFALFYTVMGLPIARWADHGNRVKIISLAIGLWSAMVALCGLATTFLQLLLIRVGAGIGEAGCVPPAHSLIADYFNRAERPRAMARFMLGGPLAVVIGYFGAGWLNQFYGWRMTFVILGLPGLVLALLAWMTLREPREKSGDRVPPPGLADTRPAPASEGSSMRPSLATVASTLWTMSTFRHLAVAFAVLSLFSTGIGQWKPSFFIRSFGLQSGEVGTWLALIYGAGGIAGAYWGGEFAARRAANNERLQLRSTAVFYSCFAVISTLIYLSPNHYIAFALMALGAIGAAAVVGPLFGTIQTLVPPEMRACSVALIFLVANLIGMGLGPLVAGVLSDALQATLKEDSLRVSLLALSPGYLWVGWHLWRASETVSADLAEARAREPTDDGMAAADAIRSRAG
jgi:MFS family permease